MKKILTAACYLIGFGALSLQASLLIYEGWDYGLADNASMDSVTTSATGLTGDYYDAISGGATIYKTAGLTFGANFLPTTGGSLYQSASGANSYTVLKGDLTSTARAHTGDLYHSALVKLTSLSNEGAVRIRTYNNGASTARYMSVMDETGAPSNPGVAYDDVTTASSDGSLSLNTTYLALSRFTNVGLPGGGTADQFIFDLAGYDNWLSAGGGLEANLATYASFTATETFNSQRNFEHELHFVLGGNSSSGSETESAFIDEVRYGTTLGDVVAVAIPEPSSFLLMAGGMLLVALGAFKDRRSHS